MARLDRKVALITGAGAGIGRAAAELFAPEGAIVLVAEYSAATGMAAVDAILSQGGKVKFIQTDVTDEASVREAIDEAVAFGGRLDVLYNNAGDPPQPITV